MDLYTHLKQYLLPALVSVVAVGLLKIGLFVPYDDLERSLRQMEAAIRSEYATKQDIQEIKTMLYRLDAQLVRLDDRLDQLAAERKTR